MKRVKQGFSIFLSVFLAAIVICGIAKANVTASEYLAQYGAALVAVDETGQYDIYYDVTSVGSCDSLGVSQIKIYRDDGTYITTITGSTNNGLIREDHFSHTGTYRNYGISGKYYYAVVTVFAERDGGSDSRDITTNTIKVP